ncbi:TetR/AcrR family transcriptional regulator C-terminal domain-containing protein [Gordonia liuliyuniae]|uniref:TetR/AcrR family transcriptional regulator C-terminal domain-containing protein n=1 Tax=Gordonia liuliyuniae TaxID=2911517 RepID=A0ABS9IUE7_9ACTN|nr:TetR/AcrR family transcriptional regulator C-terminal domain-containing protein [Gordonia liuliyuniae]MCF8589177.1 TetR/AcrR family transcriptional regulator C-terminal domain-containing protein [Gordonia liuliyuniae]
MSPEEEAKALVRLLWRAESEPASPRKGPRQRFTVDEVVAEAIALADADGLAAMTVRTLARRLGIGAMSVYTYVPTRDVLIALMVDAVALERGVPAPGATVRESLTATARDLRAGYLEHPWLLEVSPWRDALGPGRLQRYEAQLAAIDELPVDDVERDALITLVESFAAGSARDAVGARAASKGAMTDPQWWGVVGPELAAVMPDGRYPLATRVGTAVGERYGAPGSGVDGFELGLAALLDGIESRMGR